MSKSETVTESRIVTYCPSKNRSNSETPNLGNSRRVVLAKFSDAETGKFKGAVCISGVFENKPVLK